MAGEVAPFLPLAACNAPFEVMYFLNLLQLLLEFEFP